MASHSPSDGWIGASLLRKEDARHLLGHGMFIADLRMPGMQDVAFVRSQMAHAVVRQITKPEADAGNVFTLDDIGPLNILEAGPELAAHRHSPYPALADDRVRYAGQPIAACLKPTRAQAEDLADQVGVELDELPAVVDCVEAMKPKSARLFDAWPDNAFITSTVTEGDPVFIACLYYELELVSHQAPSVNGKPRPLCEMIQRIGDDLPVCRVGEKVDPVHHIQRN